MGPAGDDDEGVVNALRFKLAKLARAFLKGRQGAILRRVFRVKTVAYGFDIAKAADADLRSSDQVTNAGRARHLLTQRDEEARVHRVTAITLRHLNIIPILEKAEASRARVTEAPQAREP